ncbi:MAG: hypothetical protein ACR2H3_02360 [Acidimicrobiales bacterium]
METFSNTERTSFGMLVGWLGRRPVHRAPVAGRSELVLVYGGSGEAHGTQGDPTKGYGLQLVYSAGDPSRSTVREYFAKRNSMVSLLQRRREPASNSEQVSVRGSTGYFSRADGIGCAKANLWSILWHVQGTDGAWATMRLYLSADQFTKDQAVAYAQSFEDFAG